MNIAIMGYGTIGSGVAEVLKTNEKLIQERVGEKLTLKKVLDLREFKGDPVEKLIVHDYKEIAEDKDIDIVVETMGGVEPAFTFVKAMLEAGKHVTTSNKALVADKGYELVTLAKKNNVAFTFEASVGGGIPIIRTLQSALSADRIDEMAGILNGTTNYMLTKMEREGSDFDEVLKEAQANGYAEADPTADVEGHDACRKIAILTSIIAGATVDFNEIPTEGIRNITTADFKYAAHMKRCIKLIAMSKRLADGSFKARVAPFMIDDEHPLFAVHDVFNAVYVVGNMLGPSMYYGSGAGSLPTASAVVADVIEMAKNAKKPIGMKWLKKKVELEDADSQHFVNLVRVGMAIEDARAVFASVETEDGNPIDRIIENVEPYEIGIVTNRISERDMKKIIEALPEGALRNCIRLI